MMSTETAGAPCALVADIHGNRAALAAVLAEIDRLGIPRIICLGDVAGYYCDVDACVEALRSRGVPTLMGNHDLYLTTGTSCPGSTSANRCLEYQRQVIADDNLRWLAALPSRMSADGVSLVHGGWNDPTSEYLYELSAPYFERLDGRLFASGHTHVQGVWTLGERTYCNPGSVGQPRDGDPRAAFAVYADGAFSLHRVAYDVDATCASMARAGFEPRMTDNLRYGTRIGGGRSAITCVTRETR